MKKQLCTTSANKVLSGTKVALTIAIALAMSVAAFAGGPALTASGISAPTVSATESAGAAQRKSGAHSQSPQSSASNATQPEANVTQAKGTFEVKLDPQGDPDKAEGSTLGRMSLDKKFHGDLEATAKGTMLTAGTDVKGSAGYVAIERVTGTLNGKTGSFVLQHNATLTRGAPVQNIVVVPDSGTGQLTGISGKFLVIIADGKHSYEFDYTLPATQ